MPSHTPHPRAGYDATRVAQTRVAPHNRALEESSGNIQETLRVVNTILSMLLELDQQSEATRQRLELRALMVLSGQLPLPRYYAAMDPSGVILEFLAAGMLLNLGDAAALAEGH